MKIANRIKLIVAGHMILERDEKIFLMRRYNTQYQDGKFGLPAGHKEDGETFLQCAIREAYEEAGVKIKAKDVEFVHAIHKYSIDVSQNRLEVFFLTKRWKFEPGIVEPYKCDKAGWYFKKKLPKNMVDYVGESLKLVLKNKKFHEKKV